MTKPTLGHSCLSCAPNISPSSEFSQHLRFKSRMHYLVFVFTKETSARGQGRALSLWRSQQLPLVHRQAASELHFSPQTCFVWLTVLAHMIYFFNLIYLPTFKNQKLSHWKKSQFSSFSWKLESFSNIKSTFLQGHNQLVLSGGWSLETESCILPQSPPLPIAPCTVSVAVYHWASDSKIGFIPMSLGL